MSNERYLFTSESVTEGNPDKVAASNCWHWLAAGRARCWRNNSCATNRTRAALLVSFG